jgi:CheY-like chemotaxis protein
MKILLVEDNPAKKAAIGEFVLQEFPQDSLSEADSFILGLRRARDSEPDLILLDMSLPHHSSADRGTRATDMRPFAGADFLKRINRMKFKTKVLVVSMFETFGVAPNLTTLHGLNQELSDRYPDIYMSAIHYSTSNYVWQSQLREFHSSVKAEL